MQIPFLDLYRASLRSAADAMSASLERSVRLQEHQLDLVGAQAQRAADFWTGVWRAAGEAQKTMIERMQEQLEPAVEMPDEAVEPGEKAPRDAAELAASQIAAAVGEARRRAG